MTLIARGNPVWEVGKRHQVVSLLWSLQAWGLLLLIVMSFFPNLFHLEEYLFFALLGVAIILVCWEGRSLWVRTAIDLPLLLFVGWVLLTVPFSHDPAYSFAEWRKLVAQVFVFYWAVLVVEASPFPRIRHHIVIACMVGALAVSLFGLVDFLSRGGSLTDRFIRASAPGSDYNWLGTYMVMAVPMVMVGFSVDGSRWWRGVVAGLLGLVCIVLFVTYSRAAWLGLLAQVLTFGLLTRRFRLVWSLLGVAVIGAMLFLALSQFGFQQDTVDPWTLYTRLDVWAKGFQAMIDHPFVGSGYGYHAFFAEVTGHPQGNGLMGLHSVFFMIGVGTGVPGVILFLWLIAAIVVASIATHAGQPGHGWVPLGLGIGLMVVGFAVRNLFDYMFAGSLAYLFWILVATAMGASRDRRDAFQSG